MRATVGRSGEKNRDSAVQTKAAADRGITLIELIIGMSILLVVGLMVAQLFGSSVRMYHSTIFYSDVQTESQAVCRRLEDAVMNAEGIYLREIGGERVEDTGAKAGEGTAGGGSTEVETIGGGSAGGGTTGGAGEDSGGLLFFTGTFSEKKDSSTDAPYEGVLFWYNRESGCLYQKSGSGTNIDDLTMSTIKAMMEHTGSLISDKVNSITFTVSPQLTKEHQVPEKINYYVLDQNVTIGFELTFRYLDSGDYSVTSSATPRNQVKKLRWPAADEVE